MASDDGYTAVRSHSFAKGTFVSGVVIHGIHWYIMTRSRDEITRALLDRARRQGWVITRAQATDAGAHTTQLTALVRAGVLLRPHPGVYVVAGAPDHYSVTVRAALAAAGPTGVASHWTAGWLQGSVQKRPPVVHITVLGRNKQALAGVVIHRSSAPLPSRSFRGIACTLPARTLVDIAATASPSELADAVDRARAARIVRLRDLETEVQPDRKARRRGAGALRSELERLGHIGGPAPSVLESRMARVFRISGLPEPRAERVAGPDGRYRIDYTYDRVRLAIELYGYLSHSSPAQLKKDTTRQNELTINGWTVLIFTWRDVTDEPGRVAAQIRAALAAVSRPA